MNSGHASLSHAMAWLVAYERRSRQRDTHEDDQDPRGHQVDDERRTRQADQPQAAEERKGAEPRLQHGGDHRYAGGDIQAFEGPQHPAGGLGKHRRQKAEVEHPAGQGGLVRELQGVVGRAVDRGDERQPGDPQPQAQQADGPQRGAGGARSARKIAGNDGVEPEVDQRIQVGRKDDQELVLADVGAIEKTQVDKRERGVDERASRSSAAVFQATRRVALGVRVSGVGSWVRDPRHLYPNPASAAS